MQVKASNRTLRDRYEGDSCQSLDHVMRLPGTVNFPDANKRDRGCVPVLATVVVPDDGVAYPYHALVEEFGHVFGTEQKRGGGTEGLSHVGPSTLESLQITTINPLFLMITRPSNLDRSRDVSAVAPAAVSFALSIQTWNGQSCGPSGRIHSIRCWQPRGLRRSGLNNCACIHRSWVS